MTVCNSCRYCEAYCPVFQAMEERLTFTSGDIRYLANLCHNCGECLYACQYAPPHAFGVNVPQTLARVRLETYRAYAWPAWLGKALSRSGIPTALVLAAVMAAVLLIGVGPTPPALRSGGARRTATPACRCCSARPGASDC